MTLPEKLQLYIYNGSTFPSKTAWRGMIPNMQGKILDVSSSILSALLRIV